MKVFKDNISIHQQGFEKLDSKVFWVSWLRVIAFISFFGLAGYLFYDREMLFGFGSTMIGFILFGVIVNRHKRLEFKRKQEEILIQINQEELKRLDNNLSDFDGGSRFIDDSHSYTSDLDVFGKNSLFQLLNRSFTPTGQSKLADWLRSPQVKPVIEERQEAVAELGTRLVWSQSFQALARHNVILKSEEMYEGFQQWLAQPPLTKLKANVVPAIILGLVNVVAVSLSFAGIIPWQLIFFPVALSVFYLKNFQHIVQKAAGDSYQIAKLLQSYGNLITAISSQSFTSPFMVCHQSALSEPTSALKEIDHFSFLMDTLNNRENMLYWLFNTIFLIDIHLLVKLEQWKIKNAENFNRWIDSISEVEAVNGVAAFAHAHPEYATPEISNDATVFGAHQLGHPLIRQTERVCNDFELNDESKIGIITGSNMSGKSTFLRSIGINLLLAQIGSPVCAERLKVSPIGIFTSMRTSDNLEESVSSFYAELRRIERLIKIINNGGSVFFMLDEILKGTNTHDRQLGAKSLIKQLMKESCMGLVSTHDIALGQLGEEGDSLNNWHFSSDLKAGQLLFDYQIKEGVCRSFNASQLMAQIGIKLEGDPN